MRTAGPDRRRVRRAIRRFALWAALALVAGAAGVMLILPDHVPGWTAPGARMVRHAPLPPVGSFPVQISPGARILFEGDSNLKGRARAGEWLGLDMGGLGDHPDFPQIMARQLGGAVQVTNAGIGGETVARAQGRRFRHGNALVFLMYGTNDADPRGWMTGRAPAPLADFGAGLRQRIRLHRAAGAQVVVLAPLPAGSAAMDRRIAPYRAEARRVAQQSGAGFLDPYEALADCPDCAWLAHDALHLRPAAHDRIGRWIAGMAAVRS